MSLRMRLHSESWSCLCLLAPLLVNEDVDSPPNPRTQLAEQKTREHYEDLQSMCHDSATGKLVTLSAEA